MTPALLAGDQSLTDVVAHEIAHSWWVTRSMRACVIALTLLDLAIAFAVNVTLEPGPPGKAQVRLVPHIAHAPSSIVTPCRFGNLVTNSTWSEFFLNEGFTMYAQRRITSEVHGVPFTALETTTGRALLRLLMRDIGHDHPLTRLRVPLEEGWYGASTAVLSEGQWHVSLDGLRAYCLSRLVTEV